MKVSGVMLLLNLVVALALCAWAQLWSQSPEQSASSPPAILPAGTVIRLRTTQEVNSKDAKPGDTLQLEVMHDVKVGDVLVIAKHTPVVGTLTQVRRAPRGVRRGSLVLDVKTVSDITGNPIAIGGTKRESGPANRQADAYTQTVLSMGFFAPILFFVHGDEAVLPRGTEIDPIVSQDVALNASTLRQRLAALEREHAAAVEQNHTGEATVYFFLQHRGGVGQQHAGNDRLASRVVQVDGQKFVRLREWHFYEARIAPGHHVVACTGQKLDIELKADQRYYVSMTEDRSAWGELSNRWIPRLVDLETGEDELYTLMPAMKKDVYSASH